MPRLTLLFARRYLFSKKSHSVINIIAGVSALAVAIPAQGKVFAIDSIPTDRLRAIPGVAQWSFSLEENALFEYRDRQYIGVMRGVDSLFAEVVPIDSLITQGNYRLRFGELPEACVGQGVAYTLGIRTTFNDPISIYVPRSGRFSMMMPQSLYRKGNLFPSGVFALEAEVDGNYMIVPLDFAQKLLDNAGKASSMAIRLNEGYSPESVRPAVAALLGDQFEVLTRYQQKAEFYRIMMYEKWGIYFIILLVLIVASFSLIGSLVMLIIDKRKDTRTLLTMLGIILGMLRSPKAHHGNVSACSLCYSCSGVCPAKIDLGEQIYKWRQQLDALHLADPKKKAAVKGMDAAMASPKRFYGAIALARTAEKLPRPLLENGLNPWSAPGRALPRFARESFNARWKREGCTPAAKTKDDE